MKNLIVSVNVLSDGDRTLAQADLLADARINLEGVTTLGSSGREPGDKSNPVIGENLAVARALRSLANRLERQATGTMRHAESNRQHKEEIARRGFHASSFTEVRGFPPGVFVPQEVGPYGGARL